MLDKLRWYMAYKELHTDPENEFSGSDTKHSEPLQDEHGDYIEDEHGNRNYFMN